MPTVVKSIKRIFFAALYIEARALPKRVVPSAKSLYAKQQLSPNKHVLTMHQFRHTVLAPSQPAIFKLIVSITLIVYAHTTQAAKQTTAPDSPPTAHAMRLSSTPLLDGQILDDPQWQGVEAIKGFWQTRPNEGHPSSQRTEVYIGFTDEALYVGVIAYDDNPEAIIVADSRRDSPLDETDSFQFIVDGFLDRQNGLVFGTNPAGIEYDGQVTKEGGVGAFGSSGFNLNWDTSWEVKTALSESGWSAEFEIPFKSLRYAGQETPTWGINFQRNIRRNNEIAYWAPLARQHNLYRVSEAGTLLGLKLPTQRNLKFTPYALGQARRGGLIDGTNYDEEFGFDLKYSLTQSLTLDVTYNTDFAQVEVDELQVNLDRFSLFFPEKRPFFLENAGQFSVGTPQEVEMFFSRRIGVGQNGSQLPVDGGLRLSGKVGARTNIGLLHMRTDSLEGIAPQNDFTVVRVNRELGTRSSLGAMFVERKGDGSINQDSKDDYNRTYAIDGRWGIGDTILLKGFVAKTDTPGLENNESAYSLIAEYSTREWANNIGYTKVGENFNPEVGFLRRRDYEKAEMRLFRRIRPDDLWGLHEIRPHIVYRGFWNSDGVYETGYLHIDNHLEWKNGYEIHTGVNFLHEDVIEEFEINRGVFVPQGEYDDKELSLVFNTNLGAPLSLEVESKIGGFFGGDRVNIAPTLRFRAGERFTSELTWNYNNIDLPNGNFDVNIGRLRLSYSFTPKILLQALVQYDDRSDLVATNLRFSWLQSANAGLYLVYNEIDDENVRGSFKKQRELVLKFSRILDIL